MIILSYYAVTDPEILERGPRNIKYKPAHSVAIFVMNFFLGQGERMAPLTPPPPGE